MPNQKIGLIFVLAVFLLFLQSFQHSNLVELNPLDKHLSDETDDCPEVDGNSTVDRIGCLDTDGDGVSDPDDDWSVSDGADPFPFEATLWKDSDKDGWGITQT